MAQFNVSEEEEKILQSWRKNNIFKQSVQNRQGAKPFVFYEGPPTANGLPGIHHVLSRAFKDIILRYKTMRGLYVWRRAGWDTHGLPVEIEVEKELGLNTKDEIEEYGIAAFNKKCQESVWNYKEEWENLTERMGFWIDMDDPYITYDPHYIENLWALFKHFNEKDLLYEDFKVVPYCARCGTAVSSHEVAQGYKTTTDTSITVKFKIKKPKTHNLEPNTYLLAWTTTPWTLPGNVALAVGKDISYAVVKLQNQPGKTPGVEEEGGTTDGSTPGVEEGEEEVYILASDRVEEVFKDTRPNGQSSGRAEYSILNTVSGKDLVGLEYEPLFAVPELASEKSYRVYPADFVTTDDGTGIVHTAVMYGIDDFALGDELGLPKFHTVDGNGVFVPSVPEVGGMPVIQNKEKSETTEKKILALLEQRNFLFKKEGYEHEYPFCWRCDSPLLYYARGSWFIAVNKRKEDLVANNQKIHWVPEHLQDGRFGEWLSDVKDWAISRERYWGTPLPIWRCQNGKSQVTSDKSQTNYKPQTLKPKTQNLEPANGCGHVLVVGSLSELNEHRADDAATFVLMRHGQALSNERDVVSSYPETFENTLTDAGRKQVEKAAKKLAKKNITTIYCSDLTRTRQTADMLAEATGVEVHEDERLREVDTGEMNGHDHSEYKNFFTFVKDRLFTAPDGGENWRDIQKRVWDFAREMQDKHAGQTVLVVSHGLPLALLHSTLQGIDTDKLLTWEEKNELKTGEYAVQEVPNYPIDDEGDLNLHRPYVDSVALRCAECGGTMQRVEELADVWFDSGAMPFAQPAPAAAPRTRDVEEERRDGKTSGVEELVGREEEITPRKKLAEPVEGRFPADYITEGIDQTRGWFYTLHAISTLMGKGPAYKNVVSLELVLDKEGKKMSKSRGNIVDPWEVIEEYGIDALRWYFFTVNSPGDTKLFNTDEVHERYRKFIMTALNSLTFLETYFTPSKVEGWQTGDVAPEKSALDEWILSRLAGEIKQATENLDNFDITNTARSLDAFVQDISNWYIRRSRARLQQAPVKTSSTGQAGFTAEKAAAQQTLYTVLMGLAKLCAPFTPFLADMLFTRLQQLDATEEVPSVHLADWPRGRQKRDEKLEKSMKRLRDLASTALARRSDAGIKLRQPLASVTLNAADGKAIRGLEDILQEEVNVEAIEIDNKTAVGEVVLDTSLTPALERKGMVREIARAANSLRRKADLEPSDEIAFVFSAIRPGGETDALEEFQDELKKDARAREITFLHSAGGEHTHGALDAEREWENEGWQLWAGIKKV